MSGFCGQCGAPRLEGAKFCTGCGSPLAPTHCPTCGKSLPPGTVLNLPAGTSGSANAGAASPPAPPVPGVRAPETGPDYVPGRDCGNCGFELTPGAPRCGQCGTTNTGPTFDPRATGR